MTEVLTLKDIPEDGRPRERLLRCGGKALSDAELVAILLRSGRPGLSVVQMASEVLDECGGLTGLLNAGYGALVRHGLGRAKAATLLAAVELGRRMARSRLPERQLLNRPDLMADYLVLRYGRQDQEVMGAVFLDEIPPDVNPVPDERQQVRRHRGAGHLFRVALAVAADRGAERHDRGEAIELRGVVAQIEEVAGWQGEVLDISVPEV